MKKTQLMTVLSAVALLVLAGCGANGQQSGSSQDQPAEEKVKIEWKSTFSYTDQIDHLIEDFEKEYPKVEVTYTKISGSYSTLKDNVVAAVGAAALPNIVSCYPDHIAEYLDYGIVVDLQKYMDSEEEYGWKESDYEDFVPALLNQCRNFSVQGTYMLPHSSSTEAMFYNENILGRAYSYTDANGTHQVNDGQPITAEYLNNITWEELMNELAPALLQYNAANGNCFLDVSEEAPSAVVNYSGADNAFVTLCAEKGVEFSKLDEFGKGQLLFNDEARVMKNTLKEFNGYYKDNLFSTAGIEGQSNINVNEKLYAIFATGSTGGIKYQVPSDASFSTGVMRIPNFEGKPHSVISQGPGLCVLDSGDEEQNLAAYEFINFLNKAENTLYWALETGYFPVRSSCYDSEDYISAKAVDGKTAASLELLKAKTYTYANAVQEDYFTNAPFKGSDSARTLCGSLLNKVVGSKDEITDTFLDEQFAATVNEILNKMA